MKSTEGRKNQNMAGCGEEGKIPTATQAKDQTRRGQQVYGKNTKKPQKTTLG